MSTADINALIANRLTELHQRHLRLADERVEKFYSSGRGYYVPEPGAPERDQFAIAISTVDGEVQSTGDSEHRFPLHSLSKVFIYALALTDHGRERVLQRVGVEPSGDSFYALSFDEHNHRPHNPMVNAGALVTTELIRGTDGVHRLDRLLDSLRRYAGNPDLTVDPDIFRAEYETADRNRAAAYLLRSLGMLHGDVEQTLALYLQLCSVLVDIRELATMAATLANGGVNPITGERAITRPRVRDILSVMYTCGMYDYAGEWAYEIGLPAKSGVSGGIMAVVPGKAGIAVFSPGLDYYGNSVRGIDVCRTIADRLGLHVFATEAEDALLRLNTSA